MAGLDKRHVAGGSGDVNLEAAGEYDLPLHQLGSGSDSDDDDDDDVGKATEIPSRGHSSEIDIETEIGEVNRRRLL